MTQSSTPEQQALAVLEDAETALHQLYAGYAELIPELDEFWNRLAREETAHATWVKALAARQQKGEVAFLEGRFVPQVFEMFLTYVKSRIAEIVTAPPSLFAALSIARDIEDTIVERHYFDVLAGDSPEARELLEILGKSAHEHAIRVKEMWDCYKPAERKRPHPTEE